MGPSLKKERSSPLNQEGSESAGSCTSAHGALLVTHDYFGTGCPRNHEDEESLTSVYRSEDDGATWINVTHVMNAYWSSLFVHGGAVYLLGVSQQYGSIVIRRSDDGGFRWTHPADRVASSFSPAPRPSPCAATR